MGKYSKYKKKTMFGLFVYFVCWHMNIIYVAKWFYFQVVVVGRRDGRGFSRRACRQEATANGQNNCTDNGWPNELRFLQ